MKKPSKKALIAMAILMGGMSSSTAWADPTDVIIINDDGSTTESKWKTYSGTENVGVDGETGAVDNKVDLSNVKKITTKDAEDGDIIGVQGQNSVTITTGSSHSITGGIELSTSGLIVQGVVNNSNGSIDLKLSQIIANTTGNSSRGIYTSDGETSITGSKEGVTISSSADSSSSAIESNGGTINLKNISSIKSDAKQEANGFFNSGGNINLNTTSENNTATEIIVTGAGNAYGVYSNSSNATTNLQNIKSINVTSSQARSYGVANYGGTINLNTTSENNTATEIIVTGAGKAYGVYSNSSNATTNLQNIKSIKVTSKGESAGIYNKKGDVKVQIIGDGESAFNITGTYTLAICTEGNGTTELELQNSKLNATDKIHSGGANPVNIVLGEGGEWTVGSDSIKGISGVNVTNNNGTLELNSGSLEDVTNKAKINVNNVGTTMQSLATEGTSAEYNFKLPASEGTMLSTTGEADISNSTVAVDTTNYTKGTKVNLVSANGGLIADALTYKVGDKEVANGFERTVEKTGTGVQDTSLIQFTTADNTLSFEQKDGEFFAGKYIDKAGNATIEDAILSGEDPTTRDIYASFAEEGQKADGGSLTLDGVTLTDKTRVIKAGNREASNNIINLKGINNLGSIDISGTNNTLNVYNAGNNITGLSAAGQNLNFYITPTDMNSAGTNTMLNVSGVADVTNSSVKAGVLNLGTVNKGDKINLIKAGTLKADGIKTGTITDGMLIVDLGVAQDGNSIVATVGGQGGNGSKDRATENTKSPVETQVAGISLLNTSSDMLATDAINSAESAVGGADQSMAEAGAVRTMTPFATIGGSGLRLDSGSHVDLKSWNINVGFAKETKNKDGKLLFGPVIEYGRGNYDSYLDNGTHGDGNSSFWGVGVIAKQSFNSGLYVDGSLRVGRMSNEYNAFFDSLDRSYDNSATYYAAHVGVGNVQPINAEDSIDYYLRLFYSHQNGSSATLKSGHVYDFDAIDSWRTRLGFRYNHKINKTSSLFAGLAWQHEFGSECRATVHTTNGFSAEAPAPSVQGETGIIELGVKLLPNNNDKFEIDLGLNGYVGKQQGFGANAQFLWKF